MRYAIADSAGIEIHYEPWETMFAAIYASLRQHSPQPLVRRYATLPRIEARRDLGLQALPVYRLLGDNGRYVDFDRCLPASVAQLNLPVAAPVYTPIEVAKIGEIHLVIEGNSRVHQARQRGQLFMPAHVTEYLVQRLIDDPVDAFALLVQAERTAFFEHTGLAQVRPGYQVECSRLGSLTVLARHIAGYQHDLSTSEGWPPAAAPAHWYAAIYPLVVGMARRQDVPRHFPGYTEGDLYLWAMEHRWKLRPASGAAGVTSFRTRLKAGLRDILMLGRRLRGTTP